MKNRLIAALLALTLIISFAPATIAADAHWDWDSEGHYDISWYNRADTSFTLTTAEQLAGLAYIVNQGETFKLDGETSAKRESFTGKTIALGVDIKLNDKSFTDEDATAHQWPSIGGGVHTEENAVFNGTFDGQNHTIWNMYIYNLTVWTSYDARNRGLFGITAEQAIIENLTVRDGYVRAARSTGGIVGKTGYLNEDETNPQHGYDDSLAGHGTIIRNVHNVNTTVITTDSKGVGGIVGAGWNYALIQNCSNSGNVSSIGAYPAGGIAGENENIIENCYNSGTITSSGNNAGGIVGSNKLAISEIRNCYNVGTIKAPYAGGLAGYHIGLSSNSYNAGTVSGENSGGLFGEIKSGQKNENLYYLNNATAYGKGEPDALTAKAATLDEIQKLASAIVWEAPDATAPATDYADVPNWAKAAVSYVTQANLLDSKSGAEFGASENTSRAELAIAFYRAEGSPKVTSYANFDDVTQLGELLNAVSWANANGIVTGSGGKYSPDKTIPREQIAVLLYNYAKYKSTATAASGDLAAFSDYGDVSPWAREGLSWAVAEGIFGGTGGKLNPKGTTTRAGVAQILYNYLEA
jgi:hypothetical protein